MPALAAVAAAAAAAVDAPAPKLGAFVQFMNEIREASATAPLLSPRRFSQALHIDLQTLAAQAKVHRNTLTRSPGARELQDFMRSALRVIKAATDVNGDVDRALFWYRNEPLSEFGYKSAEQLVSDGRTEDVLRYLVAVEAGAAG